MPKIFIKNKIQAEDIQCYVTIHKNHYREPTRDETIDSKLKVFFPATLGVAVIQAGSLTEAKLAGTSWSRVLE